MEVIFKGTFIFSFRKETVVFHEPPVTSNIVSDDEEDIQIPKRQWGEKWMNGVEQTLEEEFGNGTDQDLAISPEELPLGSAVHNNSTTVPTDKTSHNHVYTKADNSSSENLSSGSSSESINKSNKKKKKSKNSSKKMTNKHMPAYFSINPSPKATTTHKEYSNHKMVRDTLPQEPVPRSTCDQKLDSLKPNHKTAIRGAKIRELSALFSKQVSEVIKSNQCEDPQSPISMVTNEHATPEI